MYCRCKLAGANYEPYARLSDCDSKSQTQKMNAINRRLAYVDHTIQAVYAYASALKTAQAQLCGTSSGVCQSLRQMSAETFHNQFLMKVNFNVCVQATCYFTQQTTSLL